MANVVFSGENKTMNITSGGSEINVEKDLYSGWKHWVQELDNAKFLQALRTFGGDPTVAGQFAPKYFFLLNGWRVVIDGNTISEVLVALNLYVEGGGTPFVLTNGATVTNILSDVAVVSVAESSALTPEEHNQLMGLENTDEDSIITGVTASPEITQINSNVVEILGLSQSNFTMINQTYSISGSLETCLIKTYPTAVDLNGDTNMIAAYDVTATYDGSGLLNSYKVVKQ